MMTQLRNAVVLVLLFAVAVHVAWRLIQPVLPLLLVLAVFAAIAALLFGRS